MILALLLSDSLSTYYTSEARVAVAAYPKWALEHDHDISVSYRNQADHSSLRVFAYQAAQGDLDARWARHTTSSMFYKGPDVSFSALPLGTHVEAYDRDSGLTLFVRNNDTFTTVQLVRKGRGSGDDVTWVAADKAGDRIDVEGVARRIIALVEGRWSTADGTARVAGRDLPRRRCRGGAVLVPLTDWATARGVSLRRNDRLGSAAFDLGGRAFVIPLGARSVKVGSTWVPFNGTVTLFDGKWYVPLDVLED